MNQPPCAEQTPDMRTPWVAPIVETMSAGDAEMGPTQNSEGQLGHS